MPGQELAQKSSSPFLSIIKVIKSEISLKTEMYS